MTDVEPIRVNCEGSGNRGHTLGGRCICAMCGRVVDAVAVVNGVAIAERHDRDDILAMIQRGDFG